MSELSQSMKLFGNMSTSILRCPSGRYGIAGSVPYELTKESKGLFSGRESMVWETEQEAIDALLAIGITHFQLADCSWSDK